jgi:hypothetical protein
MGDQGWLERLGPQGVFDKISGVSLFSDQVSFIGFRNLMYVYLGAVLVVVMVLAYLNSLKRVGL